jgi:ribosomal protein S18 acetylase RimI-like enzyme
MAQLPRGRAADLTAHAPQPRRATNGDLTALTALWIALTEHHAALDPHFALRAGAEGEARRLIEAMARDPDTAIFVSGDPPGAFAIVNVRRAPPIHAETRRAEITDVYVSPAVRRRGAGRALVRAATEWASARGAERVEVQVSPHNPEAQAFRRAHGYGVHMNVLHRPL